MALLLNLALLAFVSIAVVNVLVLATAARAREFALLRPVGAGTRQVSAMMHGEAAIVVLTSVVFGTLAAVPPLVGISLSLTGDALPSVPPLAYLGVVAVAVVLGWCSIAADSGAPNDARPLRMSLPALEIGRERAGCRLVLSRCFT